MTSTVRRVWPWGVALVVIVVLVDPGGVTAWPDVGHALVLGAELATVAAVVVLAVRPTRQDLAAHWVTPGGRMALLLVAAMFAVQYAPRPLDLHPLVVWDMYTAPTEEVSWSRYLGRGARGQHMLLGDLPVELRPFMDRLDIWVDRAAAGDVTALEVVGRSMALLAGDHTAGELESVIVERCRVARDAPDARCDVLLTVSLDPDAAPR